jgi:hypothetical protein
MLASGAAKMSLNMLLENWVSLVDGCDHGILPDTSLVEKSWLASLGSTPGSQEFSSAPPRCRRGEDDDDLLFFLAAVAATLEGAAGFLDLLERVFVLVLAFFVLTLVFFAPAFFVLLPAFVVVVLLFFFLAAGDDFFLGDDLSMSLSLLSRLPPACGSGPMGGGGTTELISASMVAKAAGVTCDETALDDREPPRCCCCVALHPHPPRMPVASMVSYAFWSTCDVTASDACDPPRIPTFLAALGLLLDLGLRRALADVFFLFLLAVVAFALLSFLGLPPPLCCVGGGPHVSTWLVNRLSSRWKAAGVISALTEEDAWDPPLSLAPHFWQTVERVVVVEEGICVYVSVYVVLDANVYQKCIGPTTVVWTLIHSNNEYELSMCNVIYLFMVMRQVCLYVISSYYYVIAGL